MIQAPRRALLGAALLPAAARAQARPTLVLVHGAWMGGAVWQRSAALLTAAGHPVLAPDLPAHGEDQTPAADATLDLYVRSLRAAIGDREVALVGHSFGGIVISALAEAIPGQVRGLVYVAGYVPRDGDSAYALSQRDPESLVGRYWRQADPARYSPASIAPEGIVATFCADCTPDDGAWLVARHRAEPVPPLGTPVRLGAGFAALPKGYVLTAADRTITPALQRAMVAEAAIVRTVELPTGHVPMLSAPAALAAAITTLAQG
jgi:pimeloyl-ACP methyl ester carboxylesterase